MAIILTRKDWGLTDILRVSGTPDEAVEAPDGSIALDVLSGKKYRKINGEWVEINTGSTPAPSGVPLHGQNHKFGGEDEIDADLLDIDFLPKNYISTPTGTGVAEVISTQHLSAHLKGIDNAIGISNRNSYDVVLDSPDVFLRSDDVGVVSDYTRTATTIKVFKITLDGKIELNCIQGRDLAENEFTVTAEPSGIDVGNLTINDNHASFNSISQMDDSTDLANVEYTISIYDGTTFVKRQRFFKYRDGTNGTNGTDGIDGTNGADAYTVELSYNTISLPAEPTTDFSGATVYAVSSYDNTETTIRVFRGSTELNSVSRETTLSEDEFTVTTSSIGITAGDLNIDSNEASFNTVSSMDDSADSALIVYTITVYGGTTFTRRQHFSKFKTGIDGTNGSNGADGTDGRDAYTIVINPESVVLHADADGVVSDYAPSATTITVFKGATELNCIVGGIPAVGEFIVSATSGGITPGNLTSSGNPADYSDASNMAVDTAVIEYEINIENSLTVNRKQLYTKVKEARDGTNGTNGADGADGRDANVATTLKVLNVLYLNEILGNGFSNAVEDDDNGGNPIQDAIDYVINNPGVYDGIYVPPGTYRLSMPLLIAKNNDSCACEIFSGTNNLEKACITWNLGTEIDPITGNPTRVGRDQPLLIIQGARNVSIRGIEFKGINSKPSEAPSDNYYKVIDSNFSDWYDSDIRDNPFSPNCAVVIDPFINHDPGGLSSNKYRNFETYYSSEWERKSSKVIFSNCTFRDAFLGTVIDPTGPYGTIDSRSTADRGTFINPLWTPNNDEVNNQKNLKFNDCNWMYNTIHYSSGQNNTIPNNLEACSFEGSYITFDTQYIGPGGSNGTPPVLGGATNINGCKYVFNVNCGAQTIEYYKLYCNSIGSIGNIGVGSNGTSLGTKFSGCHFNFISAANTGGTTTHAAGSCPGTIPAHFIAGDAGIISFDICSFNIAKEALKFSTNSSTKIILNDCTMNVYTNIHSFAQGTAGGYNHIGKARFGASYLDSIKINSSILIPGVTALAEGSSTEYISDYIEKAFQGSINDPQRTQTGIISQTQRDDADVHPLVTINEIVDHVRHGNFVLLDEDISRLQMKYRSNMRSNTYTTRGSTADSWTPNIGDIVCLSPYTGADHGDPMMLYMPLFTGVPHVSGRDHVWSTDPTTENTPSDHMAGLPKSAMLGMPIGHISGIEDWVGGIDPVNGGNITGKTYTIAGVPMDFPYGSEFKITFSRWDITDYNDSIALAASITLGDGIINNDQPKTFSIYQG